MPTEKDFLDAKAQAVLEHYMRPPDRQYTTPAGHVRNVIGVGIGPRIKDGERQKDDLCVRFYVERKIAKEAMDERFRIPKNLGELPTDVIETRRFISFDGVVAPGAPIGMDYRAPNVDSSVAGALGAVVKLGPTWYALGANHVMAVNGRVPVGTRVIFKPLDQFIDDPDKYIFARLAVHIPLCQAGTNTVDCALAAVENPDRLSGEFPGQIVKSGDPIEPQRGMKVAKANRGDSATGEIEEVHGRVRIDYRFGSFDFDEMVLIKGDNGPFAGPGDSGALVVDLETKQATAIIVGGSQNYAIACRLSTALAELVKMLPEEDREGEFQLVLDKLQADVWDPLRNQGRSLAAHLKDFFARIVRDVEEKFHRP